MGLNEKEINILTTIFNLRCLNSLQLHQLYGYSGKNGIVVTRRKLAELEKRGYLNGWQPSRKDLKIYYLTKTGANEVAGFHGYEHAFTYRKSEKTIHQTLVSEIYVRLKNDSRGKVRRFGLNQKVGDSVADAFVQYDIENKSKLMFIECDNATESMIHIKDVKLEGYKNGYRSGVYQQKFGIFPDVIFITTNPLRTRSLLRIAKDFPFKIKVFSFDEFTADPLSIIY